MKAKVGAKSHQQAHKTQPLDAALPSYLSLGPTGVLQHYFGQTALTLCDFHMLCNACHIQGKLFGPAAVGGGRERQIKSQLIRGPPVGGQALPYFSWSDDTLCSATAAALRGKLRFSRTFRSIQGPCCAALHAT